MIFFLFYPKGKNPKSYFSGLELKRKHFHPSIVILPLQLRNICAACTTSKTHSRTHWGRHHPLNKSRKTPCTRKFGEYVFFHMICRIHCTWRNIKNLRTRTAIFCITKPAKAVEITQNSSKSTSRVCVHVCVQQQHTHIHSISSKSRQHLVWSSLPYFKQKKLFYLAVSIESLLKPFLWFANDRLIIRFHYIALATHTKLNLLQYLSRQANHLCNKLAFLTVLIMKMVAFLGDKSQLFVVLLECVSQAFSPHSYRLPWINNTQKQQ